MYALYSDQTFSTPPPPYGWCKGGMMQPTAQGLKYYEGMAYFLFSLRFRKTSPIEVGYIIYSSFFTVDSNLDYLKVKFSCFQLHVYNKDL